MSTGCSSVAGALVPLALTATTRTWILSPELRSGTVQRVERKGSWFTAFQSEPATDPAQHFGCAMDRQTHPEQQNQGPEGETQRQRILSLEMRKDLGHQQKKELWQGGWPPLPRSVGYEVLAGAQHWSTRTFASKKRHGASEHVPADQVHF